MRQPDRAMLEDGLDHVRDAPREVGTVELIVRRPEPGAREVVAVAELDLVEGLVGDCWRARGSSRTEDGAANPDAQITVMNARMAALVAQGPERRPLAGDQFYVDLDLSAGNLPPGTRLDIGDAVLEVSAVPHLGCGKFIKRFGVEAMKFVTTDVGRKLNLRGINARVLSPGTVRTGDAVRRGPHGPA